MIKIVNIITGIAFLTTPLVSCQSKDAKASVADKEIAPVEIINHTGETVNVKEFIAWCGNPENKLSKAKDIADLEFKLSYLPPEWMAFLELKTQPYDLPQFAKTKENYSEMSYFKFRIEVIDGGGELLKYKLQSPAQYEERVRYTSFDMQNDLCLVQDNDTLRPGLFLFERIFEVAPYGTAMLAFDNKKFDKNKGFTIVYNDVLFDKGYVKFNYTDKQLINLPNISEL